MTDARMPSRWLTDPSLDSLSDRAWRTYAASLMWSAGVGTDGALPYSALRFVHPDSVDETTAAELVKAGRWQVTPDGYQATEWAETQSLAETVKAQREKNRQYVRAWRERQAADVRPYVSPHETGDEINYDSTYESTLSSRQGKGKGALTSNNAGTVEWPEYQHDDGEPWPIEEPPDDEWIA